MYLFECIFKLITEENEDGLCVVIIQKFYPINSRVNRTCTHEEE